MSSNDVSSQFKKEYEPLFKKLIALVRKFDIPKECFECGKELKPSEMVLQLDRGGFLIFCPHDVIIAADRRMFWRKLFRGKAFL